MSNPVRMGAEIGGYMVRPRLRHAIVHVTKACNFRCEHCFVEHGHPREDLDLAHFLRLAAELPPLLWLDIGGGEPFLRTDLDRIVTAIRSEVVHIPSNGSRIPQMLETLQAIRARTDREIVIGLSLDGLSETHDAIRRQPGSHAQVWKAFEALGRMEGVAVKITTVLTERNVGEILPLMEEVHARGADFHSVILLRGRTADPALRLPSLSELRDLTPHIFSILGRYDYGRGRISALLLRKYTRFLWSTSLRILEERRQVIPCLAGRAHLVIGADGGVSSCELLPAVGSLADQSLAEIMRGEALRQQVQSIRDKKCHCTHNCALFDSTFFQPSNLLPLLRTPSG